MRLGRAQVQTPLGVCPPERRACDDMPRSMPSARRGMTRAAHQGGLTRPGPAAVPSRYQTVPACERIIRFTRLRTRVPVRLLVRAHCSRYTCTMVSVAGASFPTTLWLGRSSRGIFFFHQHLTPWSNMSDKDLERIVLLVGCGVPGAIKVLAHVLKTCPQYASMLPAHGLVGSKLWTFYKDICGQDMAVMQAALQKLQRGTSLEDVCARTLGRASASASSPAPAPAAPAPASASASASESALAYRLGALRPVIIRTD